MASKHYLLTALVAVSILALFAPQIASALYLNRANAAIALATSLPSDAPDRAIAFRNADANLNFARQYASLPRLALAGARIALGEGEPIRAAASFSNASLEPDAIAHWIWAEAAWEANQPQVAFEHWRAAGAIEYFMQAGHRAGDAHLWARAEDLARIAVGIDPTRADAHYVLADAISHRDVRDDEALRELERAAALTRDNEFLSTILSRKGEILENRGELASALTLYQTAIGIAPLDARPRTNMALLLVRLDAHNRDRAVELLNQVIGDSPWYTAAYVGLARWAEGQGDASRAEQYLQQGLSKNPNNAHLLFALGELYARQQRPGDARDALTLALRLETRADVLWNIRRALDQVEAR